MNHYKQKGFTAFELLVLIAFVASAAISCGLLYVAWHFISKLW